MGERLRYALAMVVFVWFGLSGYAQGSMTSTNYQVMWDSVGMGGEDTSTSTSYKLRDTLTISGEDSATSALYREDTMYRGGIYDPIVAFAVYAEQRSSQTAISVLSGVTATVSSTAGFSVNDRIAIVQDEGASQIVAVGKIASIASPNIVLDFLGTNGTTPTIDGTNDYVYRMTNGSTLDLGTLSTSTVSTNVITWEAGADVAQGYSVYIMEDRSLTSSGTAMTIGDVSDGVVTAGSSEYGAISSDASLALSTFDTQDSPITTTLQQVASRTDNTLKARDFLTLKVAVSSALESATYSNTLSVIFVGDY